jgi:hypothetical protein
MICIAKVVTYVILQKVVTTVRFEIWYLFAKNNF